jgi:hypothetical protein
MTIINATRSLLVKTKETKKRLLKLQEFEDGLGSGDFMSAYSYHMSVRTRLSDHTKQTKFQSQRPNDVETPVPSIWVQKWSNIGTVSTWMGDRLEWYPPPRKKCWLQLLAAGVVSHREELIKIREGTALSVRSLVNPGPMTCGLAAIQTNKQTNIVLQHKWGQFM